MYGATNTGIRVPPPFIPALIDGEIGRFKPEGHLDLAQVQTNAISGAGDGPLLLMDRSVAGSTPISETSVGPEKESRRTGGNASHGEQVSVIQPEAIARLMLISMCLAGPP